jgi:3-deoxy-manno-octulosonate cytidylyltransferase (CMP-KDO synthetase)
VHRVTFRDPFERTSPPPSVVAVIPARFASTRLPGKPLAEIAGRPMIEHVYRRAADARRVDAVVVATDDLRIAAAVEHFGGIARMTSPAHRTGTDRIAEVARDLRCDIVVNVQGDLPLVEPDMIDELLAPFADDAGAMIATVCRSITDPAEYTNPNAVKVVFDRQGRALYFSRAPIPSLGPSADPSVAGAYKHIGMYAYRRDVLFALAALPQTPLERRESLEQLRALEHGIDIRVVVTRHESLEVDTARRRRRQAPHHEAQ